MYIHHNKALEILKEHNLSPKQTTAIYTDTLLPVWGSTFYTEMGIKTEYRLEDVMNWLGY